MKYGLYGGILRNREVFINGDHKIIHTVFPQLFFLYMSRVNKGFGGMQDLANFCGDIRDASYKQVRESRISSTSGGEVLWDRDARILTEK